MKEKCDNCDRPATVHLTEIVNGEKLEKHLCDVCAANEGVTIQAPSLNQMLEEFVTHSQQVKQLGEMVCEHCGMSFLEFRQNGLLGCPNDYNVFRSALVRLLERAHEGHDHHVGKVPATAGGDERRQNEMLRLRSALRDAVQREAYEHAAELRDRIKELEAS